MKLNFKWNPQTGKYQNGENLFINKFHIGSISENDFISISVSKEYKIAHQYSGRCYLPGYLRDKTWYASTPELMKAKVESLVEKWFEAILNVSMPEGEQG